MRIHQEIANKLLRIMGYALPYGLGQRGAEAKIALPRLIRGARHVFIGDHTFVHRGSQIQAIEQVGSQRFTPRITIGRRVYIGQHVFIASMNGVTIGDLCVLSDHVYLSDSSHGLNPLAGPIMGQPWESRGPIRVGESCFIGYRAVIMPGVTLGKHCVVGANAVVTHSFPEYSMIAGMPAKLIKTFDHNRGIWTAI